MKKRILMMFVFLLVTASMVFEARSEIPYSGYFIATQNCEAMQSFRKKTNPGNIHVTVDTAYEMISKNKVDATHYRIRVKDASPRERWVPAKCGLILTDCRKIGSEDNSGSSGRTSEKQYLLALSWQPAFCQDHQSKKECETQTPDRYDASHFTLHGLWPQPKSNVYCNVSNKDKRLDKRKLWDQLPDLGLSEETYADLIETMPGVASYLHRHEWIKHGTCYSNTPDEYFEESMMLADQVNASEVRDFFAENIGKRVSVADIKSRFNTAFGEGAADKIRIKCSNGMINELWINLNGEIDAHTQLKALLKNAENAAPSCSDGLIDPVGY